MKALLISPKGSNFYAKTGSQIPPLGLAYIAAVLRTNGHQVKILDLGIESKALSTAVLNWADVVGISADTPRYPEALSIAKVAKEAGKTVVMGGYHVTFLDREALDTGLANFVVRGEGEEIFLNLLNTLENGGDLFQVSGISFLDKGIYRRNKDAAPPSDLDGMPFPARDLIPLQAYNGQMSGLPFTSLITSRGCPYNCYFCSSSKFGGLKWRARSAKSIVDEIELLYQTYGYKAFSFMDDNFTLSPKRVFEFADELENRGLKNIRWWCFSRVDILVKNENMIRRMAEVGAYMVFLGLESKNETILESYNKHIGNDQQQRAIELLRKYGIKIHGSYILGDIKETEAMVENTIKWATQINAKTTQFSILTPYPGTALYDDVKKGNRFLHQHWDWYDGLHPVIKLDILSPKQTSNLLIKAYQSVYLNLARIFNFSSNKANKINGNDFHSKSLADRIHIIYVAVTILVSLRLQSIKKHHY
jgi:anaerobic magnesium-protoporphyrin IX monomethyl ester cyclase